MVAQGFVHKEESKQKIAESAKKQWQDPKSRAQRSKALKEAWMRRKAAMGICGACGQMLPEESGRD